MQIHFVGQCHLGEASRSKESLWESDTATDAEVSELEVQFIRQLRLIDSGIGYNGLGGCPIRMRIGPPSLGYPDRRRRAGHSRSGGHEIFVRCTVELPRGGRQQWSVGCSHEPWDLPFSEAPR